MTILDLEPYITPKVYRQTRPTTTSAGQARPGEASIMLDPSGDAGVPRAGMVVSVAVSLISISIISSFLTQKFRVIKRWRKLPCAMYLVLFIYADSFLFVFVTAILKFGLGLSSSYSACDGAILLCLVAYVSTKLIYTFLVEKVYIIRGSLEPRMKSKLWCFNTFGMLGAYAVVIVLNFVYRIARFDDGECVIGMERRALLPLIIFDLVLNVQNNPGLYSFRYKDSLQPTSQLQKMASRTFFGSLCTLTSSIVNLSVLTALNGEPGWVCLLCCNSDVLFSAIMVYWVTYHDHVGSHPRRSRNNNNGGAASRSADISRNNNNNNPNNPPSIKPGHLGGSSNHTSGQPTTTTPTEPPPSALPPCRRRYAHHSHDDLDDMASTRVYIGRELMERTASTSPPAWLEDGIVDTSAAFYDDDDDDEEKTSTCWVVPAEAPRAPSRYQCQQVDVQHDGAAAGPGEALRPLPMVCRRTGMSPGV